MKANLEQNFLFLFPQAHVTEKRNRFTNVLQFDNWLHLRNQEDCIQGVSFSSDKMYVEWERMS